MIAVIGSGDNIEPAVTNARLLGRLLAAEGYVIVSGGRDAGVMKAVNEGAKEVPGSLTIGIIPHTSTDIAPDVDVAIITDMNNARNNLIGLSSSVVIACGVDGPGTVSELALALKNGTKVMLLGADDASIAFFQRLGGDSVMIAATPEVAVNIVKADHLI